MGPYIEMFLDDLKRTLSKRSRTRLVLHRKTCPNCGKTLVNLYYDEQRKEYLCRDCISKGNEQGTDA